MTQTITLNKHINEESEWKGYHVIEPKFRIEPSRVVYSKSNNNSKNKHIIEYEYFFLCNHCGKKFREDIIHFIVQPVIFIYVLIAIKIISFILEEIKKMH